MVGLDTCTVARLGRRPAGRQIERVSFEKVVVVVGKGVDEQMKNGRKEGGQLKFKS